MERAKLAGPPTPESALQEHPVHRGPSNKGVLHPEHTPPPWGAAEPRGPGLWLFD